MVRDLCELSGMLLWLLTYLLIIKQCYREKTYGLPMVAICMNVTWEFYLAFVCPQTQACLAGTADCLCPRGRGLVLWIERAWFLVDLVIVWQLLRYGRKVQVIPEVKRFFYPIAATLFALAFTAHATFIPFHHDRDGFQDAWFVNITMSALFVLLALERRDSRGLSYPAAWTRWLGNALLAISLVLGRTTAFGVRDSYAFLYFLFVTVFLLDSIYVALLSARRRSQRVSAMATIAGTKIPGESSSA